MLSHAEPPFCCNGDPVAADEAVLSVFRIGGELKRRLQRSKPACPRLRKTLFFKGKLKPTLKPKSLGNPQTPLQETLYFGLS